MNPEMAITSVVGENCELGVVRIFKRMRLIFKIENTSPNEPYNELFIYFFGFLYGFYKLFL